MGKRFTYYSSAPGTPPVFDPTTVPDMFFWLKADVGLTLSGANVDQWDDQSGNGRDFVWDTNKPKYNATFAGGKAYVYADTLNMKMKMTGLTTEQYRTVFVIFKGSSASNSTAGSALGLGNIYYQAATDFAQIGVDSTNLIGNGTHYFANIDGALDIGAIDQNINIIAIRADVNSAKTYFNGTLVGNNANDMNLCTADHFLFSSGVPGTDYTFEGGIREVLNYERALTNTEIANIYSYLLTRI